MVRDKFVFSIRHLAVKERLLRDEKLTLEKAICMARASKASKEQIKTMAPKEHSNENPSLNEIDMAANKTRILRAEQCQVPHRNKEIVSFVVLLTRGVLVLLLVKRVVIAREKTILPKEIARSWRENSACHG